jgi:hypothetical protein
MKTTLKRGIGRSAGAEDNGNGNGNGRVAAVSAPLAPVRRYRVEAPRRRGVGRILALAAAWLFAAVLVVAAGLAGGAYLYLEEGVADAIARFRELLERGLVTVPTPG